MSSRGGPVCPPYSPSPTGKLVHNDDLMGSALCHELDKLEWHIHLPTTWTTPKTRCPNGSVTSNFPPCEPNQPALPTPAPGRVSFPVMEPLTHPFRRKTSVLIRLPAPVPQLQVSVKESVDNAACNRLHFQIPRDNVNNIRSGTRNDRSG